MPKPLRSEIPNPPDRQFAHFGVLDTGGQNKSAFFGSMIFNIILALIAIIIGASVKKTMDNHKKETISFVVPLKEKLPEPPKPKLPPPPKLPPVPKPPVIEPPKIKLPDVKPVELPKPVTVVEPKPVPVVTPAPPKIMKAAAAPTVVAVNMPAKSAAVVNNDPHPAAVRLGTNTSPVPSQLSGPAVSPVNMNRGFAGMPAGNTGSGAPTKVVLGGNGSPNGSFGGGSPVAVVGVPKGIPNGMGKPGGNGTGVQAAQVSLGVAPPPPPTPTSALSRVPVRTTPQLIYKPEPAYTADAKAAHIEGQVMVKIKVSSTGAVTVLGVQKGLGHGLDQSALQSAQGCRFKPAVDTNGNPTDWEGVVSITFQIA
jgi:periplasmic protein TonB